MLFCDSALLREEGMAFLPHGHSPGEASAEVREHAGLEMVATSLLGLPVPIPLIEFKELQPRNATSRD